MTAICGKPIVSCLQDVVVFAEIHATKGHFASSARNPSDDTRNDDGVVRGCPMDRRLATLARLISHRPFTDECVSAASVGKRSGSGLRAGTMQSRDT